LGGTEDSQKKTVAADVTKEGSRTLAITNKITKKMLGYSYLFITYEPTTFTLTINGVSVAQGDTALIDLKDDMLEITYYAEFKDGKRKSSKKYRYTVKPGNDPLTIIFDWHADPRIVLPSKKATFNTVEDIKV